MLAFLEAFNMVLSHQLLLLEILGLFAGLIVSASTFPQIILNHNDSTAAAKVSLKRQLMLVVGNVLWIIYAALLGAQAMTLACSITCILNSIVIFQTFQARKITAFKE